MLLQAAINYGECSDEFIALHRAWNQICLSSGETPCYLLGGTRTICEENDFLSICIDGGSSGENYRWNFPIEWTVSGNPTGNNVYGQCITVTDFPDYNYYPQTFVLQVWSLNSGSPQRVRVVLQDCNGDNDDCDTFLSSNQFLNNGRLQVTALNKIKDDFLRRNDDGEVFEVRIFDILGRQIYKGAPIDIRFDLPDNDKGVFIYSTFNINGQLIDSKKVVVFN